MRILILKPSSLGDVVQALPVLRLLKKHLPEAEIHWWIEMGLRPLLHGDPDLSGTVPFDRARWGWPWYWSEIWENVSWMREQRFDWVIDLQSLIRSGIMAWITNGSLTVGLDDPREGARGFYDIVVPRPSYHTHAVDWYLEVLRRLKVPVHQDFIWLPENPKAAIMVRETWNTQGSRWVIVQPGARWTNKRWPVENFRELVRLLGLQDEALKFAILGTTSDVEFGQAISQAHPDRCLDLTGKTSLVEMVEWIRLSEMIVSNDSGPMHVAAALGKPVVALFGPTDPRRTGPYGQVDLALQTNLPCVPCMKTECKFEKPMECLRAISPRMVLEEINKRLRAHKASVAA